MPTGTNDDRPNILFLLGDDWGWGDLGCFGHQRARTPHLDRLAAQGSRYTQFYVASPLCSPSRASFLTGLFPGRVGFHHVCAPRFNRERGVPDFLDPTVPTVSRTLSTVGYRTAHFGKWHLGHTEDAPAPGEYGFDTYVSTQATGPSLVDSYFAQASGTQRPADDAAAFDEFRPHSSRVIADEAISWLGENADSDAPFFMQLWLLDMHSTLDPPTEQLEEYRHLTAGNAKEWGALANYYSVLSEADRQMGRVLDALSERGLAENTIVIFTGDNGPEDMYVPGASHSAAGSAGPFRGRKRSLYEGGVRMPLIVHWPGHTDAGAVDDVSVLSSVDLHATLSAIAGIQPPDTDGGDVSAAWTGQAHRRQKPLMWEHRFPNGSHPVHCSPASAIRDGDLKLLVNPDDSRVELYDVPRDPMELTNVADRHPAEVADMERRLRAYTATLPDGPRHPDAGSNHYPWPEKGVIEPPPRAAWAL
ncbi:sulfatase [Phytoactinopolyspora endophytica]|uniref:sulfatase family protein n=1 Tax=Phytoactinopolyspora endophytica TaxID=1642495 RepID=UPI00101BC104|nr:sulfatase-like hydrolase/transferase [Phytoactinopolyspora endophytica]